MLKQLKNITMKTIISKLKKGQKFKFNNNIFTVKQKFSDWKNNEEPYLKTECNVIFKHDELEVELIK